MKPKIALPAILLGVLTWLCACQGNDRFNGMRTPEEYRRYMALNDSMQHLRPHALLQILAEMQRADDSLTYYDYYLMYGRHYLIDDRHDSVPHYVTRTLRFVNGLDHQTPRSRGLAAMAKSSLASYHYLLRHPSSQAIALYREAYVLMTESDLLGNLPDLSANLADAYIADGNLVEGSKWYRRALYLNDSLQLPQKNTLSLYMGLGRVYTALGDYEQAKAFYETADEHFAEMKPNMQSYFLNNYGNYYYYRRDYQRALQTFRRLKAHIEHYHAEDNFDMYLCKLNMADVFLNLHQPDSARRYVDEVMPYFKRCGVDDALYYGNTIRIGIAMQEHRFHDAERLLQVPPHTVCDANLRTIRNNYLYALYAAMGRYQQAYAVMEATVRQTDSLQRQHQQLRTADIMTRLTEDTIRLHHQLILQEREIAYSQTRLVSWITLGILIIVLLLFALWFIHERKRKLQTQLDLMNLRMLNVRQRVNPHFVFNVLNSHVANTSDRHEAEQLLQMTKLIRSNLNLTHSVIVSLADELDFVRQYVTVEQQISGQQLTFDIMAPERAILERIQIPSMLVQILTENAILHGLKDKEGDRRLRIEVTTDEQATVISVIDNGPGFDIRRYNSKQSHFGLSIIRTTISVINQANRSAKMRFDIRNQDGCHAILTIPNDIHYTTL